MLGVSDRAGFQGRLAIIASSTGFDLSGLNEGEARALLMRRGDAKASELSDADLANVAGGVIGTGGGASQPSNNANLTSTPPIFAGPLGW